MGEDQPSPGKGPDRSRNVPGSKGNVNVVEAKDSWGWKRRAHGKDGRKGRRRGNMGRMDERVRLVRRPTDASYHASKDATGTRQEAAVEVTGLERSPSPPRARGR